MTRNLTGWKRQPRDDRDRIYQISPHRLLALPSLVDLSSGRVEDQGRFGDCTGWAGSELSEFLHRLAGIDGFEGSATFLYWMTRVIIAGWDPADDSGAYGRDMMKALQKHGICGVGLHPSDDIVAEPSPLALADALKHQIGPYYRLTSIEAIKLSLADGFPFVFGMDVPENMMSAECERTGIIMWEPGFVDIGGHEMIGMGYNYRAAAVDGWPPRHIKAKNSWGKGFGAGGYVYIPEEFFVTGRADDCMTARITEIGTEPEPPAPVPPTPKSWLTVIIEWLLRFFEGRT